MENTAILNASEENNVIITDWQERHESIESEREQIRNRVRGKEIHNEYFIPAKPKPTIRDTESKNVAVYARVSTLSTDQTSSIENQTLYYEKKVSENPNWTMSGIFSDTGKSGTSLRHRDAYNKMILAAKDKKMDLILCASVSRFARNMTDCLEQISKLKTMNPSHPVGVYFETENIYTLDPDSEQSLHIHAMLADWESANKSRRMILSFNQRILIGQYPVADLLGYRHTRDGQLIIQPDEAITVKYIFFAYIGGHSYDDIAAVLTEKRRPTLKGRIEWNGGMVKNIMSNERRWGALEARKTIVVDYKRRVTVKNNNQRDSAYVPYHHEGIVTHEIAKAVKCIADSSRQLKGGISDITVIDCGALKGFVGVHPGWGGINKDVLNYLCRSVYDNDEIKKIDELFEILAGNRSSDVRTTDMAGYRAAPGIYFLNKNMPALTITRNNLKFNKVCHERLNHCECIEILYHPILNMLVVRAADTEMTNAVCWETDGKIINIIGAKYFAKAIYDNMQWIADYRFKFRGITKERGNSVLLVFYLDEAQILIDKTLKETDDIYSAVRYIPYKVQETENTEAFGLELHRERDKIINSLNEADILAKGKIVMNPMIGNLPSRDEIQAQLSELIAAM